MSVYLLASSAALWTKNDYKSCNLPSVDDDDAQDYNVSDDDNVDDDGTTRNINYISGDVLQPQNSDNADAIIVHCVGKQGCSSDFIIIASRK